MIKLQCICVTNSHVPSVQIAADFQLLTLTQLFRILKPKVGAKPGFTKERKPVIFKSQTEIDISCYLLMFQEVPGN